MDIPLEETPFPNEDILIKEDKVLFNFSLEFNNDLYLCNLKHINESVKFILLPSKLSFEKYEREFCLQDFYILNQNFKLYDNITNLENDLINNIRKNLIKIENVKEREIILKLDIFNKKTTPVELKINKINLSDKEKFNMILAELEKKNNQILELKNKINKIENENILYKNEKQNILNKMEKENILNRKEKENILNKIEEGNILNKELKEELKIKDKKILELEKRIENAENLITILNKRAIKNDSTIFINLEKMRKRINIKSLKKPSLSIKTNKAVNDICLFPESGNFIESSGPSIFDKENNLIKTFLDIGFCDHLLVINENIIILIQKNNIIILKLINIEKNNYQFKKFEKSHNNIIKKVIKGPNNKIITIDSKGNCKFWDINTNDNNMNLNLVYSFIAPNKNNFAYILLIKDILVVSTDILYFYKISDFIWNQFEYIRYHNVKAFCWNSMIIINEEEKLFAVGGDNGNTYILKIEDNYDVLEIKKIIFDIFPHDSLCLYQNDFLIIGNRKGDIYIYDINKDYKLIVTIIGAHERKNSFALNGITELYNGSFASFGEDNIIKIW